MLQAHDWYEARVSGLGVQFAHAVDAAVSLIEEHPEAFPIVKVRIVNAYSAGSPIPSCIESRSTRPWSSQSATSIGIPNIGGRAPANKQRGRVKTHHD